MSGRKRVELDQDTIKRLYSSGMNMKEVALAMHTSCTTLLRNWPEGLEKRPQGYSPKRPQRVRCVIIHDCMSPQRMLDELKKIVDPDDLADLGKTIQKWTM